MTDEETDVCARCKRSPIESYTFRDETYCLVCWDKVQEDAGVR